MADMEALFAEMRKAQTGGRDFAAEARAAAGASGGSDADSEDTGSEDDASLTEHLPPRAMDAARTKAIVRVSELGRATAREAKAVKRSFAPGDPRDGDDPGVPDPAIEAARHRAVSSVAAVFESACGKVIGGRWWSHFEAWLYSRRSAARDAKAKKRQKQRERKLSGGQGADDENSDDSIFDPVLPDPTLARTDKALERKLEAAGMGRYEIVGVGMELSKACAKAHASLAASRSGKRKPVKMSAPFAVSGKDKNTSRDDDDERAPALKVALTHGKTKIEVNVDVLEKLRALHKIHAVPKSERNSERRFINNAFCVLARYAAVQGAHYKAGTMQAAAPSAVFNALHESFGVEAELCASPVNCHWRVFGSAFLDVDRHFGSIGSAFNFKPKQGSFQANPPFDSAFISRLVERFNTLLRDTSDPLSFVAIVPHWPEEACWKSLTNSPFARKPFLRLKKNKHGYVAGSSATRVKRTTPASFVTDVVFLQNEAGALKWPVTAETLRAIKIGFKEGLNSSEDGDGDDDDTRSSSSDSQSGGSIDTDGGSLSGDIHEPNRSKNGRESRDELKTALRLSKGKIWDPDLFLFWGVGSAKRWGEKPAEWILDAAGTVLEAHWVGEDPDSEEEEEEEEEAEGGDSEEEKDSEDEDEASESDLELEGEAAESLDGESDDGEEEEESDEEDEDEEDDEDDENEEEDEGEDDEDEDDTSGSSGDDDDDDDDDDASSSEEEVSDERARKRRR